MINDNGTCRLLASYETNLDAWFHMGPIDHRSIVGRYSWKEKRISDRKRLYSWMITDNGTRTHELSVAILGFHYVFMYARGWARPQQY